MDFVSQIARLRVACDTGRLPADLGQWLLTELLESGSRRSVRGLRNLFLCMAAEHLEGSRKERATLIRSEIVSLSRRRGKLTTVQELLRDALEIDPSCPYSVRQIMRILGSGDNNGQMLSPDLGLG